MRQRVEQGARVGMAWPLQDVLPRAGLDHAAGVEDRHAVGDGREHAEVMCDQDDCELVLASRPVEQAQDPRLHGDVERGRRLVGDQEAGLARECDRDRDALPHPARELMGEAAQRGMRVRDAHLVQQLDRAIVCAAAVETEVAAHVLGELLADREHRMQRGVGILKDHRDVAPRDALQAAARHPDQFVAAEPRRPLHAGAVRQQAEQREHRNRLAAAALPGDAEYLGRLHVVVDAVDDGHVAGRRRQPHAQPLNRERAHCVSSTRRAVRGSKASRRLSPRKLNASTTVKIASPGNVPIHHHWKYCVPSATIDPHSAFGGCAPSPRNDRPESRRIAVARSSVARTKIGPATFGSTSRNRVFRLVAPRSRAACTYSESPTLMTRPRETRAYEGHATTTIASAALKSPRPSTAATTIARMIGGNANTRSAPRMKKPSRKPPKYPAIAPKTLPIVIASATRTSAIGSETRDP